LHLTLELLLAFLSFISTALELFYLTPLLFGLTLHDFLHVLDLPHHLSWCFLPSSLRHPVFRYTFGDGPLLDTS